MSDDDVTTQGDDPADRLDRLGHAAGAELRREPSQAAIDRVARSGRRRQVARTAVVGAAGVAIVAVAAILVTTRDPGSTAVTNTLPEGSLPEHTVTDPTVTDPTVTDPTVTDPTVTDPGVTDPPALVGPIEIGPGSEFVWGDGAVLGVDVDGRFVAYDASTFVAAALPDPETEAPGTSETVALVDRIGASFDYVMYDEGCGAIIASPAFTPFADAASGGWLTTPGHTVTTLDGQGQEANPAGLDAKLAELGVGEPDLEWIERLTPTVSIDGDPTLETLVFRYDSELAADPGVSESITWLAVWDPDTETLSTVRGDPTGDAIPFAVNGEGPVDVDGDGLLETTITSGLSVELVRLADAVTLARAERCPVTLEVSVELSGFGEAPVDFTVTATSGDQSYSDRASGEGGTAGPFVFDLSLGSTGTYVHVTTAAGVTEWEVLLSAGRNVVRIDVTPDSVGQP